MSLAKYCSQCGTLLESRLEGGRMRPVCPRCGYVVYYNPLVATGALVEREGRVLLIRRAVEPRAGYWGLPAGYVEADETAEEAAAREVREETGLEVEVESLLNVYSYGQTAESRGVLILYAARVVGGTLRAGDDAIEAAWFAPEEIPADEAIAFRIHLQVLDEWRWARTIRYRPATTAEAQVALALGRAHGEQVDDFVAEAQQGGRALLIAENRGQVVGYAGVALEDEGTAYLRHLFVRPDVRRWGIGTRLIAESITWARRCGAGWLMARLPATNPAVAVYLKAGFRVCGFLDATGGEREAALFLVYTIDSTAKRE